MATLLYRLGRFAARRAWTVVVAWLVILGLAGGAFALFGGTLTSSVSIPGTATQEVSDELADKFPQASGGTGTVVFTTTDDAPFTDEQKTAIGDLLTQTESLDDVKGSTNPFETQQQLADQQTQIDDGRR
jgi:RND superfamily putative drug exporter